MSFPRDVIILIALELDDPSILNLCRSSKRYNEIICKNQTFWRLKIEKERPGVLELINSEIINYKNLYESLQRNSFSISYERFDIYGVVKGDIEEDGFTRLNGDYDYQIGDKVYVVVGSQEVVEPFMTHSKEEALEIIKREIDHIHENLTENGYELKEIEFYYKELEQTGSTTIDHFTFAMEELEIL